MKASKWIAADPLCLGMAQPPAWSIYKLLHCFGFTGGQTTYCATTSFGVRAGSRAMGLHKPLRWSRFRDHLSQRAPRRVDSITTCAS